VNFLFMAFDKANKLSFNVIWVHSRTLNEIPYFQDRASCGRAACSKSINLYGTNQLTRFFGKKLHLLHFLFRKIHFRCLLVRHIPRRKTWKWPPIRKQKGRDPFPPRRLLIGCMKILFLKLAATIFGLDQ